MTHFARLTWFLTVLHLILPILSNASDPVRRQDKKSKAVTTLLNAKWPVTPLVLEMAEYMGEENPDYFWDFVHRVSAISPPLCELDTDRERYNVAMEVASSLLSPARLQIMKLGLSLHINSPLVEMFSQMAVERGVGNQDCPAAVDIAGRLVCTTTEVDKLLKETDNAPIEFFQIDHHFPGSLNNSVTAVLYGELGTKEFNVLHKSLSKYAENGKIDYIIRWYIKNRSTRRVRLSGYGVELQLKSTEYKSQDDTAPDAEGAASDGETSSEELDENDPQSQIEGFNFAKLKNLFPDLKASLERFRKHLVEQESELAPLKVWQFQALSLQAAESIMSAPPHEAIAHFINIAQNFPMQANSLVRLPVSPQLRDEVKNNQELFATTLNVHPSDTALFVNGMFFDMDIVDIMTLLQVLRQELITMEGLHALGLSNERMSSLISLDLNQNGQSTSGMMMSGNTVDFALDIRDSGILWVNDLEADTNYRRWPDSYMELLRPTYPGVLRNIRRNLYNLVLIIDPLDVAARPLIKLAESFVQNSAPVRVGLAMKVDTDSEVNGLHDAGVAIVCSVNYLSQKKSPRDAIEFLTNLYNSIGDGEITVADVKKKLRESGGFGTDTDDILGEDSDYDFGRKLTGEFISRTGMHVLPQALMNGVPLAEDDLNTDRFEEAILTEIMQQTGKLQKAVFRGDLTDHDDVTDYLMGLPHVMPRLNQRILSSTQSKYLDVSGAASENFKPDKLMDMLRLNNNDMTATAMQNLKYFERKSAKSDKNTFVNTVWIVGDLNCKKTRQNLIAALDYMKSTKGVRVTFLPNINGDSSVDQSLNKVVVAALNVLPQKEALDYVSNLLANEGCHERKDCDIISELVPALNKQDWLLKASRVYVSRVLGFKQAGQRGVVFNGRILGPFRDDEAFDEDDFLLLERYSNQVYGDKIRNVLFSREKKSDNDVFSDDDDTGDDNDNAVLDANAIMKIVTLLVSRQQTKVRFSMPIGLIEKDSVLNFPAENNNAAAFDIIAVVDPVSRGAQKLGPILATLRQVFNCKIRIYLNSIEKNSDMPLKSFYRFVLEPELQWNADGSLANGPYARFTHLPQSSLLTLSLHVPGNWLVESVRSVYDLDNIRLADVEKVVHSEFELEYLLLEGHCWDASSGTPPRGLQITLGTSSNPTQVDTIVMANLGYFQLKANPGAWLLKLRQGRSADIYDIASHEGSDTPPNSEDIKILISSLRSHVLKLRVSKKPGKQNMDLLSDSNESGGGIWNSITSSFSGTDSNEKEDEKINIFSLASGHLYERFLRIMMLSVLKNTKSPVKFWFLKNYLSPSFKDVLPYMAKEYGFEYELVQYKWPKWLHQQTEKQRIIWGYKILFLDVLFPLDVKKIIFVDADQIVRADMKELVDFDLGGAPYGYTPFCESRKEMDGFRFWKQGYWKNHLQGRRYHISALYVVDLKRFRRIAAGDRLRGQYQALSQDPNSLSNLDQDLPNNMIHQVAIKSLPQEWLWCETWCDDASKASAKTIDLCNNPMTKEAKLTAAVRIVPEWTSYDEEVKRLQQRIQKGYYSTDNEENVQHVAEDDVQDKKEKHAEHSEL